MSFISPPPKNATILQLPPFLSHPPQEPKETVPEVSTPMVEEVMQTLEAPSQAVSLTLEVAIPAHMAPLCLQLGGIKRVYRCQTEGCSEGPSTLTGCYLCTCLQRSLRGDVGMSLLYQDLPELGCPQTS